VAGGLGLGEAGVWQGLLGLGLGEEGPGGLGRRRPGAERGGVCVCEVCACVCGVCTVCV
jgi:hypothetical protein